MKMHYQMRKNVFRDRLAQVNHVQRYDTAIKQVQAILLGAYLIYSVITDTIIIGAVHTFGLTAGPFDRQIGGRKSPPKNAIKSNT